MYTDTHAHCNIRPRRAAIRTVFFFIYFIRSRVTCERVHGEQMKKKKNVKNKNDCTERDGKTKRQNGRLLTCMHVRDKDETLSLEMTTKSELLSAGRAVPHARQAAGRRRRKHVAIRTRFPVSRGWWRGTPYRLRARTPR